MCDIKQTKKKLFIKISYNKRSFAPFTCVCEGIFLASESSKLSLARPRAIDAKNERDSLMRAHVYISKPRALVTPLF